MIIKSLQPFIPSGKEFQKSKDFFVALGFNIAWEQQDYVGFQNNNGGFILQRYDDRAFAENLMISISIDSVEEFYQDCLSKNLVQTYGIAISKPTQQPYGLEVTMIDLAGVCWHFIE
jgi:predicted lactoylglutathione lyase